MTNLSSLMAPDAVVMTIYGAISRDKVGTVTIRDEFPLLRMSQNSRVYGLLK